MWKTLWKAFVNGLIDNDKEVAFSRNISSSRQERKVHLMGDPLELTQKVTTKSLTPKSSQITNKAFASLYTSVSPTPPPSDLIC